MDRSDLINDICLSLKLKSSISSGSVWIIRCHVQCYPGRLSENRQHISPVTNNVEIFIS